MKGQRQKGNGRKRQGGGTAVGRRHRGSRAGSASLRLRQRRRKRTLYLSQSPQCPGDALPVTRLRALTGGITANADLVGEVTSLVKGYRAREVL